MLSVGSESFGMPAGILLAVAELPSEKPTDGVGSGGSSSSSLESNELSSDEKTSLERGDMLEVVVTSMSPMVLVWCSPRSMIEVLT